MLKMLNSVRLSLRCSSACRSFIFTSACTAFLLLSSMAFAQAGLEKPDPTELVRRTISKFKVRELKARDYAFIERVYFFEKHSIGKLRHAITYEVIPLGMGLYRRQIRWDDQPLSQEEEKSEQQKLEAAIKRVDAEFDRRAANPDANLPDSKIPTGTPLTTVMFDNSFQTWQMDIDSLPEGFNFRFAGEEISDGRKLYLIEGDPAGKPGLAVRDQLAIQNFTMKMWVDESEEQLVKLEARAIKKGMLSQAEYAKVNPNEFDRAAAKAELDSLYESALWYERGTVITRKWKKVSPEVWLTWSLHVKGKVLMERKHNRDSWSTSWDREQETTYWNYRKFTVTHRLLPHLPEVEPVPEAQPAERDRAPKGDH
jgi:hypothetical protein